MKDASIRLDYSPHSLVLFLLVAISAWYAATARSADPEPTSVPIVLEFQAIQSNIDSNNYPAAIASLEAIIQRDPSQHKAWEMLGWAYWRTGQQQKAIALWEKLRFINPNLPLACNLLARASAETNGLRQTIGYLRESLRIDPDQPDTLYYLARVLRWNSEFPESIGLFEKTLELRPDDPTVQLELARACTADWQYAKALPIWQSLLEAEPDNQEYAGQLALCELHTGNREGALEQASEIIEQHPEDLRTLEVAIAAAELSDDPAQALDPLRRLMEMQKTPAERERVRVRLIRLLIKLFQLDPARYGLEEAISHTQERVDEFPTSADARLLMGELCTLDGQLDRAIDYFNYVIERLNPYNRRAYRGLFEVYVAKKDFAKARIQLAGLATFNPMDPYLYYHEARLQAARTDYYAARAALDQLEAAGARGAVACLLYHGLTPSPYFADALYVDRFRDHMQALMGAGVEFVRAETLRNELGPAQIMPPESNVPDHHPKIRVQVNFDDARRDSMRYGTQIAQELGLVFTMHIPVGYILQHHSFICTWEQLREYKQTGRWEYGSHLLNAAILSPVNEDGTLWHNLPNRIWLPEFQRLETPDEYHERVKRDFEESQRILRQELGGPFNFVSYPFGDIGQEDTINVKNPIQTVLANAAETYDVGFIQSSFGYAVAGDNPLLYQRTEPDNWMAGSNLVEMLYENHPVFLARRMRAEFAALEGKPHLALEMLKKLKEDGYPDTSYDKVSKYVRSRLAGQAGSTAPMAIQENTRFWDMDLRKPYLDVSASYFRDNQTRKNWGFSVEGGANLTPALKLGVHAGIGQLKQDATSNDVAEAEGRTLKVDEKNAGAKAFYKFSNGISLAGDLTLRDFSGDASHNEAAYSLETQFRPILFVDVMLRFEHDMVPSALAVYQNVRYNAPLGYSVIHLQDWWNATLAAAHYDFSDSNDRDHLRAGTSWTIWERTGMNIGLNYAYVTSDEDREAYWTPYELNRYFAEVGFKGTYLNNYYDLSLRYGRGRESVRPEDKEAYSRNIEIAKRDNWTALPEEPEQNWEPVIGASISLRIPIRELLKARLNSSYNKLPNYNEFNLEAGLELTF